MKPGTKKLLNFLLIFGTLVVVLLVGFNGEEMTSVAAALKEIAPAWIALCALAYGVTVLADAASLHLFLRRQGQRISFGYAIMVSVMGSYYSNITPGASGGQPMQVYYLAKRKVPVGLATSALTVKFFCFQFMLAVVGTVLWIAHGPFIYEQLGRNRWILIVGYSYNCFSVCLVLLMALVKKPVQVLIRLALRLGVRLHLVKDQQATLKRWDEVHDTFYESIRQIARCPVDLLVQLALATLHLLSLMTVICFVYEAFGLEGVGYWQIIALGVMLYTSAAYTPLPGASGAQEGVFALYFAQVFPDGIRLMALLLWRFFTYYGSLIVGAVVSVAHGFLSGRGAKRKKGDAKDEAGNQA